MADGKFCLGDGNEAAASVAYRLSEMAAIYPITPSSPMAELYDGWSAAGKKNIWGTVPAVVEMQSEAGVAGTVHGALHCGSIVTTFTASQGLLLMVPALHKIAGELLPFCLHVTGRAVASHALSIFGDHSDAMACRGTGFALLASASVQEAHDFAAIATAATFESRIPFLHLFDGFRTSHEINGYCPLADAQLEQLLNPLAVEAFRLRALDPDRPTVRGTAQNPDVFFQGRERANPFYAAAPDIVAAVMERFARIGGRSYRPFDYAGPADAETVFICMGSATETVEETIRVLNGQGARLGLVRVRLYRPFSPKALASALPPTAKDLLVLDRTKESGSVGEPLYLDVLAALEEARRRGWVDERFHPAIFGGRYGLGSKEFSPPMVKGLVDALGRGDLGLHFTVGIEDDVSHLSVPYDGQFQLPAVEGQFEAIFHGLGADGTVGANKNSIKIIGEETGLFAQAYFVYDSKKSGSATVSHLRFGPKPIRAPYLIQRARFIGCHQFSFLEKWDLLTAAEPGAVFLLNAPFGPDEIQAHLPRAVQEAILDRHLRFFAIDAYRVAEECAMGRHINTIMQTCFFAISGILPRERAIDAIKRSIEKSYGRKGRAIVEKNFACVDATLAHLFPVELDPGKIFPKVPAAAEEELPAFVSRVTVPLLQGRGDLLPVGALPVDGTWPSGTARYERRGIAREIPIWDPTRCIQCAKCALICPHAAIRAQHFSENLLEGAPDGFRSTPFRSKDQPNRRYAVQVAPDDCTGCGLCGEICPMRTSECPPLSFHPRREVLDRERENFSFFRRLPQPPPAEGPLDGKSSQFRQPLFEFSGACAGCGETAYIKLLTQLFGDHLLIANATGCSSIYGGNLPTTPYCQDAEGRGPAWANSLFEDNAEFGLGMLLAVERRRERAEELLRRAEDTVGEKLAREILRADQSTPLGIALQRARVAELKRLLVLRTGEEVLALRALADDLVHRTVWTIGGDGWAYDIGFGGLDHALAMGKRMRILVLDTEAYSNTGGQQSKATPLGAVAKFAATGKASAKKDLGRMAMAYGHCYVAQVALGAKDSQTVQALLEAESFPGAALVIAYCPCIAHGYDLGQQLSHQKAAVAAGHWPLYRFDPRRKDDPLQLDSKAPTVELETFFATENRFQLLAESQPERAMALGGAAQLAARERFRALEAARGDGR
ncbi:MAG: pyruvate:ferredoxin (flavodoxin) oxidoreductase [Puniceicoccales bacterium]|jgi:pyruvate-ferredoxin/flavodoxin oxidoreductase|nr:pyruvate:ferredoxin (flavodoxin) oxidoreductase [Puniceicoccales bacterium]